MRVLRVDERVMLSQTKTNNIVINVDERNAAEKKRDSIIFLFANKMNFDSSYIRTDGIDI